MKLITTLEELVEHAVAVAQGRASWEGVDILPGAAAIPIRVEGAGWGKHIDARGAAFVTSMQAKLDEMFGSYPGQLPSKAPFIKVEVHEGSNKLLTHLEPLVKMVIDKVSAEQVVEIIKYGVLCLGGFWTVGKVVDLIDKMDERRIAKEEAGETLKAITEQQKQALAVISQSLDTIRQIVQDDEANEQRYAAPLKRYINSLDNNDRVTIGEAPPVNVQRAKKFFRLRRRPRSDMYHVVCDAPMNVLGLNFEKPKPRLDIEQDGKKYIALIERLSDEERQYLISQVDNRLKSEGVLCMDLRVTAYFKNSGLNRICIVGLGKPRENVTINALMDIPNDVRGVFDEFQRAPDS